LDKNRAWEPITILDNYNYPVKDGEMGRDVECVGGKRNAYRFLVGKTEGEIPLVGPKTQVDIGA
jgi:hypothetical protein